MMMLRAMQLVRRPSVRLAIVVVVSSGERAIAVRGEIASLYLGS